MFTLDATPFATDGYVRVTWDDAGIDPTFYAWRIYRRKTGTAVWTLVYETTDVAAAYELHDYFALAGVPQDWALTQVTVAFAGAPQAESPYQVQSVTPVDEYYWLIHPTDPAFTTKLYQVTSHSDSDNYEQATIPLLDRGYHVEQGTNFGETGSLTSQLVDRAEITARQQREKVELIKRAYSQVWLRTPFGDLKQIAIGQLAFDREAGVGVREHGTLTIPYTEVT